MIFLIHLTGAAALRAGLCLVLAVPLLMQALDALQRNHHDEAARKTITDYADKHRK